MAPLHIELSLFVRERWTAKRFRHFDDMQGCMVRGFRLGAPGVFVLVYWESD